MGEQIIEVRRSRNSETMDVKFTKNGNGNRDEREEGELSAPVFHK